jgi:hypothetical protein
MPGKWTNRKSVLRRDMDQDKVSLKVHASCPRYLAAWQFPLPRFLQVLRGYVLILVKVREI